MKKVIPLLLLLLFAITTHAQTATWIDQLKEFRSAVYQRDKEKAKQFFKFPVANPGASFWSACSGYNDEETGKKLTALAQKEAPLTEKLFVLYFDQIFHKQFVTSFLKLKTSELYEKGQTQTPDIEDDSEHFYLMIAKYDAATGDLSLTIRGRSTVEGEDGGEYSYQYKFRVINGQLTFITTFIAG
ncbi:hypothetical protein [Chitinophaga pinensis]|uniref:Uncharacterized protein n=1 Tax=Chitinophaga pinensis (strain ATCC 43595 / DSM 2588 / LMG 13176 / NBRC 15968 / NCIMB 11800 / UQM 2034) TaxID=485918 RepID=A0A979G151_CHIPD|nr:hypothetical protein [Chitinophaga pinensis]ACU58857.1 hypothetical protein Cpin_1360 [Chitinophaga pinensis DSM 2588]